MDNIERDEPDDNQEEYESQYTEEDIALLDRQEKEKRSGSGSGTDAKRREQEALAELEKALAEARLRGQREVMPSATDSTANGGSAGYDDADQREPSTRKAVRSKLLRRRTRQARW